jgi:hypothetical protein
VAVCLSRRRAGSSKRDSVQEYLHDEAPTLVDYDDDKVDAKTGAGTVGGMFDDDEKDDDDDDKKKEEADVAASSGIIYSRLSDVQKPANEIMK